MPSTRWIVRALNQHEVRFVVIRGIAADVQGAIWATADELARRNQPTIGA